jgi:hypothetical protein
MGRNWVGNGLINFSPMRLVVGLDLDSALHQETLNLIIRPEFRQEHPLNLSISISGGKETNQDSPSNGE